MACALARQRRTGNQADCLTGLLAVGAGQPIFNWWIGVWDGNLLSKTVLFDWKDQGTVRKIIVTCFLLILCSGQARAENCPDFFRFVDFGREAPGGEIHRGGPTFRAESFGGEALLIRDRTTCRRVRDLASDGRGNPIPVVASVDYDPEKTGIGLNELRLTGVEDVASETERNAAGHREKLDRPIAVTSRGSNFLCASVEGSGTVSCQLISPFGGNLALVVYCSPVECEMPVLAVKPHVIASAKWRPSHVSLSDHEALARQITDKVQQIHDFLAPLSS